MDVKIAWNDYYGKNESSDDRFFKVSVNLYNKLATNYDKICDTLGYHAPEISVKTFMQQYEGKDTKHLKVLDIGVGTGLVGEYLRKYNFEGVIDGLDGNQAMMDIAVDKGIYKDLWYRAITPDDPFIVKPGDLYDGVIASASIGSGHVDSNVIFDLFKIIKPESLVVIANRTTGHDVNIEMESLIQKIEELKLAELISKEEFNYYDTGVDNVGKCVPIIGHCFCFKKL